MNVELLNTDQQQCSWKCGFSHMTDCFPMKVYHWSMEVRDPFLFFTKWTQLCHGEMDT